VKKILVAAVIVALFGSLATAAALARKQPKLGKYGSAVHGPRPAPDCRKLTPACPPRHPAETYPFRLTQSSGWTLFAPGKTDPEIDANEAEDIAWQEDGSGMGADYQVAHPERGPGRRPDLGDRLHRELLRPGFPGGVQRFGRGDDRRHVRRVHGQLFTGSLRRGGESPRLGEDLSKDPWPGRGSRCSAGLAPPAPTSRCSPRISASPADWPRAQSAASTSG
jgi:hypothetical protein